GEIRILARGSDVPSLRGQTVRTLIVNADSLKTKRDAIMRFMEAYREAVDWMYSDPQALEMYSKKMNQPVDLLKESMEKFQPKETDGARQVGRSRRSHPRWGAVEVSGKAADPGADRRAVADSAAQEVIRRGMPKLERAAASSGPFVFRSKNAQAFFFLPPAALATLQAPAFALEAPSFMA